MGDESSNPEDDDEKYGAYGEDQIWDDVVHFQFLLDWPENWLNQCCRIFKSMNI